MNASQDNGGAAANPSNSSESGKDLPADPPPGATAVSSSVAERTWIHLWGTPVGMLAVILGLGGWGFAVLRGDMDVLRADVGVVREDVGTLRADIAAVKARLDTISDRLPPAGAVTTLQRDQYDLVQRVSRLEATKSP